MQTTLSHSDYSYLFGLVLLALGAAWIPACIGYMLHYFPEHGGGAVVVFTVAALVGAFFIHVGRTMINAKRDGPR